MEIRYSNHLLFRIKVREIPEDLPRKVYRKASRRFFDQETATSVAVYRAIHSGKRREMAVVYRRYADTVVLITIHPLKSGQLGNRLRSGRWQKIHR